MKSWYKLEIKIGGICPVCTYKKNIYKLRTVVMCPNCGFGIGYKKGRFCSPFNSLIYFLEIINSNVIYTRKHLFELVEYDKNGGYLPFTNGQTLFLFTISDVIKYINTKPIIYKQNDIENEEEDIISEFSNKYEKFCNDLKYF